MGKKRASRGRPPVDESDRLKSTSVGFSENDRKLIDPASDELGENFGEFVRTATLEKAERVLKRAKAKPATKATKKQVGKTKGNG